MRVVIWSTTFPGCLCKSMADSHREMLSQMQANLVNDSDGGWHPVCGGCADADRQAATLFAGGVGSQSLPVDHQPTGLHCVTVGGCCGMSASPAHRRMFCHCHASCMNITPSSPDTEVLPQCQLIRGCQIFDIFWCPRRGRLICRSTYTRVYMMHEFSCKIHH